MTEKIYFSKDPEGVQYFPGVGGWVGVQLFPGGGGPNANFYRNYITCDFPGGS